VRGYRSPGFPRGDQIHGSKQLEQGCFTPTPPGWPNAEFDPLRYSEWGVAVRRDGTAGLRVGQGSPAAAAPAARRGKVVLLLELRKTTKPASPLSYVRVGMSYM